MRIEMMCPKCLSRNWKGRDGRCFVCEDCGSICSTNEMIAGADFYVYQFVNDDWGVPFYVGKGCGTRYKTTRGRSLHIQQICSRYKWHPEIVRHFDDEKESYEYEVELKREYKLKGYPIIDGETSVIHKMNQREGIARAKAEGKYKGGKARMIPSEFRVLYNTYLKREITKSEMARKLKISRPTLDKWIKEKRYESSKESVQ